jgi:membrane-bound lytic murein transglycosylase F
MFRGIKLSAAWLGCAAWLLLFVNTAHATARPLAPRDTPTAVSTPSAPGVLRVLAVRGDSAVRDRDGSGQAFQMLKDFALALGRRLEWSEVSRPDQLFETLATGSTDVVVGPGPDKLEALPAIAATSPVATERYVVVGRTDNPARNPLELKGMSVAMALASPYWNYFERVREVVPGLKLHALSNDLKRDAPLQLVADGMVDIAIVAVTGSQDWFAEHPRVKPLFNLTKERPLSWYVRRDDALLASLNQFIERYHTAYFEPSVFLRDFAAIKQRGVLRVITRVEDGNYFIREGKPSGFELELARAFAERHGLRLEVRVAQDDAQIFEWLEKGAGDIVTSRVVSREAHHNPGFTASRIFRYDAFATVSRRDLPLRSPADLAGLVFAATEDSAEYRALLSMREEVPGLTVIAVSPQVSEELLLERVAHGMVDATVVTGQHASDIAARYPALIVGTSIAHRYDYRWTVRGRDDALLAAVNRFLGEAQSSGLTPMLAARYGGGRPAARFIADASALRLSPYDPIVQHYANRYGFDWRLIAAQMYQESQFNPGAVSPSGARGLMQLMPSTAQSLGFADVWRPDSAIHAGVKYLYELRNEFDAEVPAGERTWFALAAYNLGPGRLERARRMAARLKLDPNRWSGNVEVAMLKLAHAGGGIDRRYGQALIYVRAIQSLYGSYRSLQVSSLPGVPRA